MLSWVLGLVTGLVWTITSVFVLKEWRGYALAMHRGTMSRMQVSVHITADVIRIVVCVALAAFSWHLLGTAVQDFMPNSPLVITFWFVLAFAGSYYLGIAYKRLADTRVRLFLGSGPKEGEIP